MTYEHVAQEVQLVKNCNLRDVTVVLRKMAYNKLFIDLDCSVFMVIPNF